MTDFNVGLLRAEQQFKLKHTQIKRNVGFKYFIAVVDFDYVFPDVVTRHLTWFL